MQLQESRSSRAGAHEPALWPVTLIFVVPALLIAAMFSAGHVLGQVKPSHPPIHRLGVVNTRFGVADIVCGGDMPSCGSGKVGLRFRTDAPGLTEYFGLTAKDLSSPAGVGRAFDQARFERLMRAIAGDPPAGTRWAAFE